MGATLATMDGITYEEIERLSRKRREIFESVQTI
jgi:hypothetical protein